MVIFNYKCPVCKEAHTVEGEIGTWYQDSTALTLRLKVKLSPEQRIAGDKLLCSEECDTTFRDARKRANEAYDAIMADYHGN